MNPWKKWEDNLRRELRQAHSAPPPDGWQRLERALLPYAARKPRLIRRVGTVAAWLAAACVVVGFFLWRGALENGLKMPRPSQLASSKAPEGTTEGPKRTSASLLASSRSQADGKRPEAAPAARLAARPASGTAAALRALSTEDAPAGREPRAAATAEAALGASDGRTEVAGTGTALPEKPVGRLAAAWRPAASAKSSRRHRAELSVNMQGSPDRSRKQPGYLSPPASFYGTSGNVLSGSHGLRGAQEALLAANLKETVVSNVRHRFPLQLSLMLSYPLNDRFSVEAGLSYAFLLSDIRAGSETAYYATRQRLHYVGIPLRFRFAFLRAGRFSCYAVAGGKIEKNVKGVRETDFVIDGEKSGVSEVEHVGRHLWQGSFTLHLGVQAEVFKGGGFFLEPGLGYYLPDGSSLPTLRKERPFDFNWQAGFRFSLP